MNETAAATDGESRVHDAGAAKRGYGQLAGWATLIACVLAVPSSLLIEPLPDPIDYTPTVLGAIIGVIWIRFPWERHSVSAFHVVGIVAALDIALAVRTFTPLYAYFYFLVAIYIAYVYADWNQVVPHLLFLSLLTCLPIIHSPETTREGLRIALFAIPVQWMAAGIVSYLRNELEQRLLTYRRLAAETGELAGRIRRSASAGLGEGRQ